MALITNYTAATTLDANDVLIKDGVGGTKKITAEDAARELAALAGLMSPINHRNIWRGKDLGTSITDAQKAAIQGGTFDDLFIGDFWTRGGTKYRIADMDYWLNCGNIAFNRHHLVMIPDSNMYKAKMNETNTTDGGYMGSKMYTEGLEQAKATISAAFGDMVLTHREVLTNAATGGHASGFAWVDSSVELMNEIMVYGCHIFAAVNNGTTVSALYTIDNSQLAIFRLNPAMIKKNLTFWLRDVVSSTHCANVNYTGMAYSCNASDSNGVRPVFPIG